MSFPAVLFGTYEVMLNEKPKWSPLNYPKHKGAKPIFQLQTGQHEPIGLDHKQFPVALINYFSFPTLEQAIIVALKKPEQGRKRINNVH